MPLERGLSNCCAIARRPASPGRIDMEPGSGVRKCAVGFDAVSRFEVFPTKQPFQQADTACGALASQHRVRFLNSEISGATANRSGCRAKALSGKVACRQCPFRADETLLSPGGLGIGRV